MVSRGGRKPESIGAILKECITSLGWERRLLEEDLLTDWERVVGPQIASHARPSHVTSRRLTVVTESPVWTQQLALLKPDLLRRIARCFGPEVVSDLYFVTGTLDPAPPLALPAARSSAPVEIPADFAAELAAIADGEVRESVRRLILASLADGTGREAGSP